MNLHHIIRTALLTFLIATPALAQTGFPSCTGQPVLTGDLSGTVTVGGYVNFVSYSDVIDTSSGTGCTEIAALPDSVVCFEPSNSCTVTARFISPAGTDATLNAISGCDSMPSGCLGSVSDASGQLEIEAVLGNGLHCFIGSATDSPSEARFEFDNLATCGTLLGGSGGGNDLDRRYFIPAAARASGAGGSFFVTDVDINNSGGGEATFKFLWLPRDTDNSAPVESTEFTIGAGVSIRFKDVLEQVFNVTGNATAIGALAVLSNSRDLLLMSRTFNQSDEGTFGQAIVGVRENDLIRAGDRKRVLFMTETDDFRSNLGFQNGTDEPLTIEWQRFEADGSVIDSGQTELPPLGNTQWNRVFRDVKPIEAAYVDVWSTTSGAAYAVYGSVLDSTTSDPTTVPGQ